MAGERKRLKALDRRKRKAKGKNVAVTDARRHRQAINQPQEVMLSDELTVVMKRPTSLGLAAERSYPSDVFESFKDTDRERGAKEFYNNMKATMHRLSIAIVAPGFDSTSSDPDKLWPSQFTDSNLTAATRYMDEGLPGLERYFRESGMEGPLARCVELRQQALGDGGANGAPPTPSSDQRPDLRSVGGPHGLAGDVVRYGSGDQGQGMGSGGNGEGREGQFQGQPQGEFVGSR